MATLTVTIIAATTASANPTILPEPTEKTPLNFTSTGGAGTLTQENKTTKEKHEIKCEKVKNKGAFTSAEKAKDVEIDFEGCTELKTGSKCKSVEPNDTNGTILVLADITLVDILPKSELTLGALLELLSNTLKVEPIKITCGVGNVQVEGSVIGLVEGIKKDTKTKTGTLQLREVAEKQEFKECDLLEAVCLKEGKHIVFELQAKFNAEEAFAEGREKTTDTLTFEKEAEVHY